MPVRRPLLTALLALTPLLLPGQPQQKMNQTAGDAFAAEDKALNEVYQKLRSTFSKNPVFLKNLKAAQRLWLGFRDAQLAMKFPDRPAGFYGSGLAMCKANYLAELTHARTSQLQEWLNPQIEGDVCAGTLAEGDAN